MAKTNNCGNAYLEALPDEILESKLNLKRKTLLGYMLCRANSEFCKTNGYFFDTNQTISKEVEIAEKNLRSIFAHFEDMGWITRTAGERRKASEYVVNKAEIYRYFGVEERTPKHTPKIANVPQNVPLNFPNVPQNVPLQTELLEMIKSLSERVLQLENEVERLKSRGTLGNSNVPQNVPLNFPNVPTDTDTYTESYTSIGTYNENLIKVPVEHSKNKTEITGIHNTTFGNEMRKEGTPVEHTNDEIEVIGMHDNDTHTDTTDNNPAETGIENSSNETLHRDPCDGINKYEISELPEDDEAIHQRVIEMAETLQPRPMHKSKYDTAENKVAFSEVLKWVKVIEGVTRRHHTLSPSMRKEQEEIALNAVSCAVKYEDQLSPSQWSLFRTAVSNLLDTIDGKTDFSTMTPVDERNAEVLRQMAVFQTSIISAADGWKKTPERERSNTRAFVEDSIAKAHNLKPQLTDDQIRIFTIALDIWIHAAGKPQNAF